MEAHDADPDIKVVSQRVAELLRHKANFGGCWSKLSDTDICTIVQNGINIILDSLKKHKK